MILTLGGKNETAIVFQPAGMREIELVGVAEIARKLQDFSTAGCINVAMLLVLIESADSQGFSLFDTVSSLALRSSELLLTLTNGLPLSPHVLPCIFQRLSLPAQFCRQCTKKMLLMYIRKGVAWWLNIAGYKLCWIITPATVNSVTSRP
jgi:hypothetical protein